MQEADLEITPRVGGKSKWDDMPNTTVSPFADMLITQRGIIYPTMLACLIEVLSGDLQ